MAENQNTAAKKSVFDNPLLSTKVKSANAKLFPEGVLGYFIGPTLALLANSVLSNYFNKYMTDVLNITAWAATFFNWLPVISVIFVILGNIIVGRLMDKSRTKAGKARPLLLISIPLAVLALIVLFVVSPYASDTENIDGQILLLSMIAIGYNLWFAIAYPFYYTPHAGLVNLSTRNSKDRSLLATISNATTLAAMGLTTMILPFFLNLLFVPLIGPDGQQIEINGVGQIDKIASFNHWKVFVVALMVITAVGVLIEYFFTRERVTEESFANGIVEQKKAEPISKQAKVCFKDKFWWIIIIFFFLYQLGGMLKNVSQLYFCTAQFKGIINETTGLEGYSTTIGGSFSGTLAIIGAIPTALGMVLAWPLSNKIGKGKAILFGAILSAIGGAIGFIAPDNFVVVCISFAVKALGSTPAMYLSLALLADVLDHQEAMHGFRTDGFTMTIYGAIMAGMTGIATGVLNITLSAAGYSSDVVSSPAIQTAMTWVFIGGETICYALIALIFIFMGVEKFTNFDKRAIVMDQKAKAEAEGVEYIDPAERLRMEEEQAEKDSEEARKAELRKYCEKKGLSYEEEEAKYEAQRAQKEAAAEARKAAAEAKKKAAEEAKAQQYAALSDAQKAEIEQKKQQKAEKLAQRDAATLVEFNKLRQQNNKPVLE
ncbi:MAG TPA: MFS transporter [Candidatus Coproplasma avicola]|uniref:MFS transporter n=1 Tax=Candidatus Coproplasma avicola TaxID=2840744 RepID=A0A9D1J8Z5_9FIRM|nr:MFS transporter [Candidatus Coproplasma avicola]